MPAGTNKIKLRGISAFGNNLYIDNITICDTACGNSSIPFFQDFDLLTPPSTGCFTVTNNNNDGVSWITSSSIPMSSPNSMYISQNASLAMNDWFFTPGLSLTGGKSYVVAFYYRNNGAGFPGKLEVKWGTTPDVQGMTGGQIWNNSNIQTTIYQVATTTITPSSNGVYYIGWHGYSAANMQFLCVDDISIDEAIVTWNGSVSSEWSDPLNWTPGVIPNKFQSVIIPQGMLHNPIISVTGIPLKQMTINSGAVVTINSGAEIDVTGDIIIQDGAFLNNSGLVNVKGNINIQN